MKPELEMRLYEIFGVNIFRKLVFFLEKLVHRKDKGSNINYHIPRKEISALDAFIKYLFYNGAIHARNLLYFAIYILLKLIFRWNFRFYDIIICLLALKDLYCVMLQRHNYLRIQLFQVRMAQKQAQRKQRILEGVREHFENTYDTAFAKEDLRLIQKIKLCIKNRETIILTDEDIAGLDRLMQATNIHNH